MFWSLTLPLFSRLARRHRTREEAQESRADYRAGVLASLLFNAHRGEKQKPMGPADFFANLKPPPKTQSVDEMFETMMKLAGRAS